MHSKDLLREVNKEIEKTAEWSAEIYRKIHMYPEIGNEEYRTASLVEACLAEIGLASRRPLATSVIAEQKAAQVSAETADTKKTGSGKNTGRRKRAVLRCELDAIDINEETGLHHASCRTGFMHACGHDIHIAVILGTAKVLSKIKDKLNIDIKYIFQQDEEGNGKGKDIVALGEINENDTVLGLHVRPSLVSGTIGVKKGIMHGASLMFDIQIDGRKSHGAMPHLGRDAVAAASAVVYTVYASVGRKIDPVRSYIVSFGSIKGGTRRNVIADSAELSGIIRAETSEMCGFIGREIEKAANNIAEIYGCSAHTDFTEGYPPLINDYKITEMLKKAVSEYNEYNIISATAFGQNLEENKKILDMNTINVEEIDDFSLTVDDFAYYLQKSKGTYFYLGSGFPGRENSDIHTSTFCADERCIKVGISTLTAAVLQMNEETSDVKTVKA